MKVRPILASIAATVFAGPTLGLAADKPLTEAVRCYALGDTQSVDPHGFAIFFEADSLVDLDEKERSTLPGSVLTFQTQASMSNPDNRQISEVPMTLVEVDVEVTVTKKWLESEDPTFPDQTKGYFKASFSLGAGEVVSSYVIDTNAQSAKETLSKDNQILRRYSCESSNKL